MASQLLLPDGGWGGTGYLLPPAGVAMASSSDSMSPASNIRDGNLSTLWRPATSCDPTPTANRFCCEPSWVQLSLPGGSVIDGVVIRSPRVVFNGGRVLTGRLELLSSFGTVTTSVDAVFSPLTRDWAMAFPNVLFVPSGGAFIRFRPGWTDAANAGVAEIELYAP